MAGRAIHFPRAGCSSAGFTLLELAVVIAIAGVIMSVGVPSYQRIQRNARFSALINDYRVFAGAFQQYSAVNAAWPAYAGAGGDFPPGMEPYLNATGWNQPTVFGGHYNWDRDVTHNGRQVKAAIAIYAGAGRPLTMTEEEMLLFDRRYDDGDLTTGSFQKGFNGCPLYIIEGDAAVAAPAAAPAPPEATPSDLESLPTAEEETAKRKPDSQGGKEKKAKPAKDPKGPAKKGTR
ncbi:MAG: type II secretion system protein [Verrucomicrobiota bacterium]